MIYINSVKYIFDDYVIAVVYLPYITPKKYIHCISLFVMKRIAQWLALRSINSSGEIRS